GAVLLHHAAHLPNHLLVRLLHLSLHLLVHLLHLPLHLLHHLHHLRHALFAWGGIRPLRQRRFGERSQEREHRESGDHSSHSSLLSLRVMEHSAMLRAAARSLARRIRNTGISEWRNTASATEPKTSRPRPLRP